jgi:hypothetical protein
MSLGKVGTVAPVTSSHADVCLVNDRPDVLITLSCGAKGMVHLLLLSREGRWFGHGGYAKRVHH